MREASYYRRNRGVILDKDIKREYGKNRYNNMSEEKKQRLKEYQRNYHEAKKST